MSHMLLVFDLRVAMGYTLTLDKVQASHAVRDKFYTDCSLDLGQAIHYVDGSTLIPVWLLARLMLTTLG